MIESGPAAGVVAASHLGQLMGERSVLSFDMGGTTAKAGSILDSRPDVVHEYEVGGEVNVGRVLKGSGHPVRHPFIDLVECSAGGGSVAWVDEGGALRVGPLSAGADPGPACYGRGDHPTITDADLVLGRLPGTLAGDLRLDRRRAERAIAERIGDPLGLDVHEAAEGILRIADSTMSRILRIVSLERGRDPRRSVLMAFGGGGPLHCCSVAGELGMEDVLVPPHPGVFSAMGLLFARVSAQGERAVMRDLRTLTESDVETILQELEEGCGGELGEQEHGLNFERMADLRYEGQSFELSVRPCASAPNALRAAFERMHLQLYGHVCDDGVELVNLRAVATVDRPLPVIGTEPGLAVGQATIGERGIWWEGQWHQATVLGGDALAPGERIDGPVVRFGYDHTLFVPPGWALRSERSGCLRMRRSG